MGLQLWESFLLAFSALLPLMNPLGSALVFLGLVGDAPAETYRKLARKIAILNIIFLGIIELLGSAILNFFGLSLPIVQLAGGLVIVAIGWSVLNEPDATAEEKCDATASNVRSEHAERVLEDKAFYPFTFPVTSGPGTLVAVLTLTAHNSDRGIKMEIMDHVGVFVAVVVLSALVYACYAYAPRITKAIAPSTAHGILRVMAFILVCIGVQIAWNGLSVLLSGVLKG
jgi:multiple antibiotic resistance protein